MLNGYIEQHELDDVDARLLIGIATKNPTIDSNQPPQPKVVVVESPPKPPKKYASGHFVEMALGMPTPQRKKTKTTTKEVRIDTASSTGLNDRIDVGMSPTSLRQSIKGKTANFGGEQSPKSRRTRSPRNGDQVQVQLTNNEELDEKTMSKLFRHLNNSKTR